MQGVFHGGNMVFRWSSHVVARLGFRLFLLLEFLKGKRLTAFSAT